MKESRLGRRALWASSPICVPIRRRLSQDAVQAAREFIGKRWGDKYLPAKPDLLQIQAGRPGSARSDSSDGCRPHSGKRIKVPQQRAVEPLYPDLEKVRSLPDGAGPDKSDHDRHSGGRLHLESERVCRSFSLDFWPSTKRAKDEPEKGKAEEKLPELSEGQPLDLLGIEPKQHFTQPAPRYTEATLIKTLEELGIGRPSTYATIISTVVDREYVLRQKQRLLPTELGMIINRLVSTNFPNIVDVKFTAGMEKDLDEIEHGGRRYQNLLSDFYGPFSKTLDSARKEMTNLKSSGLPTELKCPRCTMPLAIRLSRNGPFLACSGYPNVRSPRTMKGMKKGTFIPSSTNSRPLPARSAKSAASPWRSSMAATALFSPAPGIRDAGTRGLFPPASPVRAKGAAGNWWNG